MNLLSGGTAPLDSTLESLQSMMRLLPSAHFVSFAQAILYRALALMLFGMNLLR
jgi:ABC-2 type transport system permease protein